MSNVRHSAASPEWYTPVDIVDAARTTMGDIDVDPASCEEANKHIWAKKIFTAQDSGLKNWWRGRVFLNPPGGLVNLFWLHLMAEIASRHVEQAIWIGFSVEQLQTLQSVSDLSPLDFNVCIPKRRIAFIENRAMQQKRMAKLRKAGKKASTKSQPSHANYIAYYGVNELRFRQVFGVFGQTWSAR